MHFPHYEDAANVVRQHLQVRTSSNPFSLLPLPSQILPFLLPNLYSQIIGYTKSCIEEVLDANPPNLQAFMAQAVELGLLR